MSNLGQPAPLFSFFPWLNLALNSNTEVCHDVTSLKFQSSDTDKSPPPPWASCSNTDIRCVHTHTHHFFFVDIPTPGQSRCKESETEGRTWRWRLRKTWSNRRRHCQGLWLVQLQNYSCRTIHSTHSILPSIIFSISPLVFLSMVVGGSWSPAPGSGLPHHLVRPWRRPWTRAVREPWEDGSISQDSSSPAVSPMRIFSAMLMESPGWIQVGWETWNLLYCIRSCIHIPFCVLLLLYSNCILWLKLPYITVSHFGACEAKETLLKTCLVATTGVA